MIKMMMRLQKSQVPDSMQVNAGMADNWYPHRQMVAGYKNYDAVMVGAAGGYGGNSTYNGDNIGYGGGPGGGGTLRQSGPLSALPFERTIVSAGAVGSVGANAGKNQKGGTGGTGGASGFHTSWANGGKGGEGGDANYSSGLGGSGFVASGGDGGDNSKGLGTGGDGGVGYADGYSPNWDAAVVGTAGGNTDGTTSWVGGIGGGGGVGRLICNGSQRCNWHSGSTGSDESLQECPGAVGTAKGGPGGGGDIRPTIDAGPDTPLYYGTQNPAGLSGGVVWMRFT